MNRILTTQGWLVLILILSFIGLGVFGFLVLTKEKNSTFEAENLEDIYEPLLEENIVTEEGNDTEIQTEDAVRVMAPEEILLSVGETKTFSDLKITFKEVVSDSRCPEDVQCIQAGEVVVKALLQKGDSEPVEKTLTLGISVSLEKSSTEFEGFSISLFEVNPRPSTETPAETVKTQATFRVSPLAKADNI